jgi:N-acetylneuraminic acid mutarotase
VGGLLLIVGQETARAVDTVQVYDPAEDRWRAGPSLPVPLDHAAVTTDGHRVYVIGGQTDDVDGEKVVQDEVWMLDLDEAEPDWEQHESLPEPRAAGAAAWDGERLVFAGGFAERSSGFASSEVWALEGSGWIDMGHLQRARQHLAAATDGDGQVWFLGGKDPDGVSDW